MTPEIFEKLPIIALRGTENNDLTGYTDFQRALLPYIDLYHNFLWVCFFGTLIFLISKYLLIPLYQNKNASSALATKTNDLQPTGLKQRYISLFGLDEIKNDIVLQLFGGAILLSFIFIFKGWEGNSATSLYAKNIGEVVCWPFFQSCTDWIFLQARPYGYSQNVVFMGLFALIITGFYGLLSKQYVLAHFSILILFLAKIYFLSINYGYGATYNYYLVGFCFIFLFVHHKRFFASLCIVLFYFISTASKIHESWTLGTYFTALQLGIPIFPNGLTPFVTNFVIFAEMIGAWYLFSKNIKIQRIALFFFVAFHLYSGILVSYHFPLIATPALLILFGPLFKPFDVIPKTLKSIRGWSLMALLIIFQMISHVIPGDEKLTMEGNFYGLYMFEANHQCAAIVTDERNQIVYKNESAISYSRCDTYKYWFRQKSKFCSNGQHKKYSLQITHSINGGPFYMIVDEPDLCALTYKPFSHNEWIKTQDEAVPVARPRKNFYK